MTPTVCLWICLGILLLAILLVIAALHRPAESARVATTVFCGWMATDANGDVFLYGQKPHRTDRGEWEGAKDDDSIVELPIALEEPMRAPKWEEDPVRIELWVAHIDDTTATPYDEDDEPF